MKTRRFLTIARISGALCAVAALFIIFMAVMAVNDAQTVILIIVLLLPVLGAILLYNKKPLNVFIGGILCGACGIYIFINQIISLISGINVTNGLSTVIYIFALLLIETAIFALVWYKKIQNEDTTFAEFTIIQEKEKNNENVKNFTIEEDK